MLRLVLRNTRGASACTIRLRAFQRFILLAKNVIHFAKHLVLLFGAIERFLKVQDVFVQSRGPALQHGNFLFAMDHAGEALFERFRKDVRRFRPLLPVRTVLQ